MARVVPLDALPEELRPRQESKVVPLDALPPNLRPEITSGQVVPQDALPAELRTPITPEVTEQPPTTKERVGSAFESMGTLGRMGFKTDPNELTMDALIGPASKYSGPEALPVYQKKRELAQQDIEAARAEAERALNTGASPDAAADIYANKLTPIAVASSDGNVEYADTLRQQIKNSFVRGAMGTAASALDIAALGSAAVGAEGTAEELLGKAREFEDISGLYPSKYRTVQDALSENKDLSGKLEGLASRALEGSIENTPMILESLMGAAGARYLATRGAEAWAKKYGKKATEDLLEKAGKWGTVAGAYGTSTALESGEIFRSIYDETGQLRPGVSLGFGAIAGALDAIVPAQTINSYAKRELIENLTASIVKRYGIQRLKDIGEESATEFLQTFIEKAGLTFVDGRPLFTKANLDEALDAAFIGAVLGGGVSVGSQALQDLSTLGVSRDVLAQYYKDEQVAEDTKKAALDEWSKLRGLGKNPQAPEVTIPVVEQAAAVTPGVTPAVEPETPIEQADKAGMTQYYMELGHTKENASLLADKAIAEREARNANRTDIDTTGKSTGIPGGPVETGATTGTGKPIRPGVAGAGDVAGAAASGEAKQQLTLTPIPYDTTVYDPTAEGNKRVESGEADIIDYGGRKIVLRNINGVQVPFYLSTGQGGKTDVPAGKWYPFFGIGPDGWINKTGGKEITNYYNSPALRQEAELLDSTLGDIRNEEHAKVGLTGAHIDAINSGLTPTENNTATTLSTIRENIKNIVSQIEQPSQPTPTTPQLGEDTTIAWSMPGDKTVRTATGKVTEIEGDQYVQYESGKNEDGTPIYDYVPVDQENILFNPTPDQVSELEAKAATEFDKQQQEETLPETETPQADPLLAQAKQLATALYKIDPQHQLIPVLRDEMVNIDDVNFAKQELAALQQEIGAPKVIPGETAATAPEVRAVLDQILAGSKAKNNSVVVDSYDQLPENLRQQAIDADAKAFVDPATGIQYYVASAIPKNQIRGAVLHERGAHVGLTNLIGKDRVRALANRVVDWTNQTGEKIETEIARLAVEAANMSGEPVNSDVYNEEVVAYFTEIAVNQYGIDPTKSQPLQKQKVKAWLKELWNAVTQALKKLNVDTNILTAEDIVNIVYAAARIPTGNIKEEMTGVIDKEAAEQLSFVLDEMGLLQIGVEPTEPKPDQKIKASAKNLIQKVGMSGNKIMQTFAESIYDIFKTKTPLTSTREELQISLAQSAFLLAETTYEPKKVVLTAADILRTLPPMNVYNIVAADSSQAEIYAKPEEVARVESESATASRKTTVKRVQRNIDDVATFSGYEDKDMPDSFFTADGAVTVAAAKALYKETISNYTMAGDKVVRMDESNRYVQPEEFVYADETETERLFLNFANLLNQGLPAKTAFQKAYVDTFYSSRNALLEEKLGPDKTGWIKFTDPSEAQQVKIITGDTSTTGLHPWCVGQNVTNARNYLGSRDFWVYMDKGKTVFSVLTEKDTRNIDQGVYGEGMFGLGSSQRVMRDYAYLANEFTNVPAHKINTEEQDQNDRARQASRQGGGGAAPVVQENPELARLVENVAVDAFFNFDPDAIRQLLRATNFSLRGVIYEPQKYKELNIQNNELHYKFFDTLRNMVRQGASTNTPEYALALSRYFKGGLNPDVFIDLRLAGERIENSAYSLNNLLPDYVNNPDMISEVELIDVEDAFKSHYKEIIKSIIEPEPESGRINLSDDEQQIVIDTVFEYVDKFVADSPVLMAKHIYAANHFYFPLKKEIENVLEMHSALSPYTKASDTMFKIERALVKIDAKTYTLDPLTKTTDDIIDKYSPELFHAFDEEGRPTLAKLGVAAYATGFDAYISRTNNTYTSRAEKQLNVNLENLKEQTVADEVEGLRATFQAKNTPPEQRIKASRRRVPLRPDAVLEKIRLSEYPSRMLSATGRMIRARNFEAAKTSLRAIYMAGDLNKISASAFTMTTSQITDLIGDKIPHLRELNRQVQRMSAMRTRMLSAMASTVDPWVKFQRRNPEGARLLGKVMHYTTLSSDIGIDPTRYATAEEFIANDPGMRDLNAKMNAATDARSRAAYLGNINKRVRRINTAYDLWNQLGKINRGEGQRIFKRVKEHYKSNFDLHRVLLDDMIAQANVPGTVGDASTPKGRLMAAIRRTYADNAINGVYFPLVRYGNFWVSVGKGTNKEFYMFENQIDRNLFLQDRVKQLQDAGDLRTMEQMQQDLDLDYGNDLTRLRKVQAETSEMLKEIFTIIDTQGITDKEALKDAVYQMYLMTLPEREFRKQFVHRKGTAGFSGDVLRNFVRTGYSAASQLARLKYQSSITTEMDAAHAALVGNPDKPKLEIYLNAIGTRIGEELHPDQNKDVAELIANGANQITFFYFLANARAALVNLTAIPVFGFPVLGSQFGYTKATITLGKYMNVYNHTTFIKRDADGNGTYTPLSVGLSSHVQSNPILAAAFDVAANELNITEFTRTYELLSMARTPTSAYQSTFRRGTRFAVKTAGALFHHTERLNREVMFMTSFELAYERALEQGLAPGVGGEAFRKAIDEAEQYTYRSMFNYTPYDRPAVMRGPAKRMFFQFALYKQQQIAYYVRNYYTLLKGSDLDPAARKVAFKQLIGTLIMTGAFAGVTGVFGFNAFMIIVAAIQGLIDWLRDNDEPEYLEDRDILLWFKNVFLPEYFGEGTTIENLFGTPTDMVTGKKVSWSTIIEKGPISAISGVDIASSISQADIWFRDARYDNNSEAMMTDILFSNIPSASLVFSAPRAYDDYRKGYTVDAMNKLLPNGIDGVIEQNVWAKEGVLTKGNRDVLLTPEEITASMRFWKAIGFNPTELSRMRDSNYRFQTLINKIEDERSAILNRYFLAVDRGDSDKEFQKIFDRIDKFNRDNPYDIYQIGADTLDTSLMSREELRAMAYRGVRVPEDVMPDMFRLLGASRPRD